MANNTYDKLINWLKNNPIIAALIFGFVLYTSVGKIIETNNLIKGGLSGKETTEQKESNPKENNPSNENKPAIESRVEKPTSDASKRKVSTESFKLPTTKSSPDISNSHAGKETREPEVTNNSQFLNTSIKNSPSRVEVCVTITDKSGKALGSESSAIAEVYRQSGKNGKTGLFRSTFLKSAEFQELREGNSEVMEKLNLLAYTDFIAIGAITYAYREGKLVDETVVCSITLSMDIISASTQSIEKSFTLTNINGNGSTEDQAREKAFQKLLDTYYTNYSTL